MFTLDSVPPKLRSSLDGPKWTAPTTRGRTRDRESHNRGLSAAPSKSVRQYSVTRDLSAAPVKFVRQSSVDQNHLKDSVRRLFDTSSSSSLSPVPTSADSSSSDAESDAGSTPRASRNSSFLSDLVPRTELLREVVHHVSHSLLGSQSLIGRGESPDPEPPHDSRQPSYGNSRSASPDPDPPAAPTPPNDPPPPGPSPRLRSATPIMATVLPKPKDIVIKAVKPFDGTPSALSSFDTQIRDTLAGLDIPVYYGGCVSGNEDDGYNYVAASTAGCKSNYRLGLTLCSSLATKFTLAAAQWWEDYSVKDGHLVPNCWKKSTDPRFIPAGVVEVSLFELLEQQFDPTVDAQHAELELDRYRWNPLDKKSLGVIPFRGHVNRLCSRAGKSGWALKGKAIRNTFPDWLKRKVNVTKTEDAFWSSVEECVNTEMMDRLDSGDKEKAGQDKSANDRGRSSKKCIFCGFPGHEVAECRKMQAARNAGNFNKASDNRGDKNAGEKKGGQAGTSASNASKKGDSSAPASDRSRNVTCYNCQRPGHISTFCPEPKRDRKVTELPANVTTQDPSAPVYLSVPAVNSFAKGIPPSAPHVVHLVHDECVDEKDVIVVGPNKMELPLYHALTMARERQEVFTFSSPSLDAPLLHTPTSVMHSYTRTPGGQKLFTIWDTAALLSMIPMSTVTALNLSYTPGSDVSFVVANGSKMSPVGFCTDMKFSFPEAPHQMYGDKVYVVESAPFQLLLGVRFLHRYWAGIFLPWAQVTLLKPHRVQIQGSLTRPSDSQPLMSEVIDDLRLVDDFEDDVSSSVDALVTVPMQTALEVGRRDLVAELDSPVSFDSAPALPPNAQVSRDFVRGVFTFGSSCPPHIVDKAIDLVIAHWEQFSWHEMDLGCISDVPYETTYTDNTPCVCKSRRHNYAERNAVVIEAKSRPLIELGVYRRAGPEVVDKAQLVVVRTKPEDPMNLKYCRVAHDFRCKNDKAVLVPVPMATRPELYSFLTKFRFFWKTDADRGFLQVVQSPSAIRHTGFELFHELYVSERMLFGQINGPSFFELNFNVMARDLKFHQKVVKNFFDDILEGANSWEALLESWGQLLSQAKMHGWKFKPAKTEFGFEEIVAVGAHYSGRDGTIRVVDKLVDAVRALRFPRTVTEVRSLLGLFNQFRDRGPGYALRVSALTQLTRSKQSVSPVHDKGTGTALPRGITMTVEAVEEFKAMQDYLLSPAVLVVFRHGWRTFLYTDASLGTTSAPGGLGAVITQLNPEDGKEYVCAFASAGLTAAQRNYPPVRLEALAFVFVLGKYYDWLEMNEFTWRTDARAHKYITDSRLSPNQALARYFLGVQAFRFNVEWIPGLRMIADPLSRMVVVPDIGGEALSSKSLVFGSDIAARFDAPGQQSSSACALFTWSLSNFPPEVGEPSRCLTKVDSALPPVVVQGLLTAPLPLSALSAAGDSTPDASEASHDATEVGNIHTFNNPIYSWKDRVKLRALPHVRAFLESGLLPADSTLSRWVKWLAKRFTLDSGVIWKVERALKLKVLESPEAILVILKELHDGFGHRALPGVYHHFQLRYWIPAAAKVIKQYIDGCSACQRLAAPNKFEVPGYQIQPNDIFSHWSVDCIGPFPADPRTGDLHVIIAVDWLSRWAEARAVNNIDADTCSEFLYSEICCRYGVPESLRSDHGRSFDNAIVDHLAELLRINYHMSTPYYPQSNGLVERLVQTFKSALRRTIQDQLAGAEGPDDEASPYWAHLVPSTLYAYRTTPHSALGVSPAEVVFGRNLRLPGDSALLSGLVGQLPHKEAILQRIRFLTDVIPTLRALPAPKDSPIGKPHTTFAIGDNVWVRDSKYDTGFPPVFALRWKGPFIVKDKLDRNVYRLRTNPSISGKRTAALALPINGSRLRLATDQELSTAVSKLRDRALLVDVGNTGTDTVDDVVVSFVLPAT